MHLKDLKMSNEKKEEKQDKGGGVPIEQVGTKETVIAILKKEDKDEKSK